MARKIISLITVLALVLCLVPGPDTARAAVQYMTHAQKKEWNFIKGINQYRIENGLTPLTIFDSLQECAHIRAGEIGYKFSHTRPDGSACSTVLGEVGLSPRTSGENLGHGTLYRTAREIFDGWKNSPAHNRNMLKSAWGHMGVSHRISPDGTYSCWSTIMIPERDAATDVYLEGAEELYVQPGTLISSLNVVLVEENSIYGRCICPLIDEMCTGYDPDTPGRQTVQVSFKGHDTAFDIVVGGDYKSKVVRSIELDRDSVKATMKQGHEFGATLQLSAKVKPASAAENIAWASSDESVATVDENGLVTAVGFGKCHIVATATDGGGAYASCRIVISQKMVTSIDISGDEKMKTGDSQTLDVAIKAKRAYDQRLEWVSSDESIATVDENGVVTAHSEGRVTISCTSMDGSNVKAKIRIRVKD